VNPATCQKSRNKLPNERLAALAIHDNMGKGGDGLYLLRIGVQALDFGNKVYRLVFSFCTSRIFLAKGIVHAASPFRQ
jgi:hypothetical protein